MLDSFIALDIETTGLVPGKDNIIEIGALKVRGSKVVDRYSVLINPERPIPEKIVQLTGIDETMLKFAKRWDEIERSLLEFLEDDVLLGHNILFDYSFLKANFARNNIKFEKMGMDTLTLSKYFHGDLPSKSLVNMCAYYRIINESAHRAYSDAKASSDLYFKLLEQFYNNNSSVFKEKPLVYKVKKEEPITIPQKNYLLDLIKYHKIDFAQAISELSKSQASKIIDKIILENGRIR